MKYYFVSDDRYFLIGLESVLASTSLANDAVYILADKVDLILAPERNDVVVISVKNSTLRKILLRNLALISSKVILILKQGLFQRLHTLLNPWVLAYSTPKAELIRILFQVKRSNVKWHLLSENQAEILGHLGNGLSHKKVSHIMKISSMRVYSVTREMKSRLGLRDCNTAFSILVMRDMFFFTMNKTYPTDLLTVSK